VDQVLVTVRNNLLEGALLVIAILFAFLGNLRAGLVVALAIPLSMLFAFNAMLRFGIAGSLMSLGAIDFGLVVDSSVIMVENAVRRVGRERGQRRVRDIVRDAAIEVRRPTLFGELIIAIVYLPVLALEGIEGKLFRPMALTVIFALTGSMILSLTLMPALASLVLRRGGVKEGSRLERLCLRAYGPVLSLGLRQPVAVVLLALVAVIAAGLGATRLGSEFIPRLREQAIVINTVRLAGVSLEESLRYGTRIERLLLTEFPDEIQHIWSRTGTAEVATDPMGLELTDIFMTLTPRKQWTRGRSQDELVQEMSRVTEGLPGMRLIFTQPIEMRMNEMIAGIRADVGVKLFGDDFVLLGELAERLAQVMGQIPGAVDVTVEQVTGLPILKIDVDRVAIARFGIAAQEVLEVVEALGQRQVGEVMEGQMRFPLVLRLSERYRDNPELIERILVMAPSGERVPLGQLASIRLEEQPSTINREWARRRIVVQANVRGRDVGSFVNELKQVLASELDLPTGYYVAYGGQFEHLERARRRLMLVVPLALLLILGLLYLSFGRFRDAILVYTGVPLAVVGGVAALLLRGLPFTISAGVGFVVLFGVAVLGQLVLVTRIRQLLDEGLGRIEAIRQAAETRLRPVLMTGLVAALGFVPMALNTGVGAEVQRPLATVVVGGMVTATLATLVVMPAVYALFGAAAGSGSPTLRLTPEERAAKLASE
jgi:cobalt-zinc-cadmium resistance protein CzcA